MAQYEARFIGRNAGALGVRSDIIATVQGSTPEQARLNLYERFEHISNLHLVEVLTPERIGDLVTILVNAQSNGRE